MRVLHRGVGGLKKQGDAYLKLITILLAVVIGAYVLLSALLRGERYTLETTAYCEVGDGLTVSGFVVREEAVIAADVPFAVCELREGEWVGGGQRLVTGYASREAKRQRETLDALRSQRKLLSCADDAALDGEISALLVRMAEQTARRDFDAVHAAAAALTPLVQWRGGERGTAQLAALDRRIEELERTAQHGASAVLAERAGYFSTQADGLETVLTPAALETMTLAGYHALPTAFTTPKNAVGRLIFGQKWYFVTELPAERAAQYAAGDRLTVDFARPSLREVRMRIERIGAAEDGACLAVLSCERGMQNVTALRRQTANLVFQTHAGLRVPKTALYHLDGEDGVYVLEGARAVWKPVTLLYECGESFLAAWDSGDTDNLWPGDELILTSDELYNGKVMQK